MGKTIIPKSFKKNIERAMHNLYQEKSTTLHPMTLVPIYCRRMFKGDRFDFGIIESILRSEPTFSPLLSNWRLRFEWYFDSDANRYGWIDNNSRLTAEEVMNRRHHTINLSSLLTHPLLEAGDVTYDETKVVGRGSILDYAGVAPGTTIYLAEDFQSWNGVLNLDFILSYLNIIRNYHCNNQFPDVPYVTMDRSIMSDYVDGYRYGSFSRADLDNLFLFFRSCYNGAALELNDMSGSGFYHDLPDELVLLYESSLYSFSRYLASCCQPNSGLFCSEFEPDLFQNLLNKDQGLLRSMVTTEVIDGQSGITIEQFRLKNHLQGLYDEIFVSGGTERDLSRTIWGIDSNRQYDIPELICVHSEIIGTNLITSTTAGSSTGSSSDPYSNVPGSMAGNINTRRGPSRSQRFTAHTAGNLMCIVSLVPLPVYNENIERHLLTHRFMDEFTPNMARKGFESVPLSDYCTLPLQSTSDGGLIPANSRYTFDTSVGKQVAWLREMTAVNRCHGEFSNGGEKYDWLLHRRFKRVLDSTLDNESYFISPYGLPTDFQYPFVSTDILSPNFDLQVAIKCDAYRPIPRKFMPNLGF